MYCLIITSFLFPFGFYCSSIQTNEDSAKQFQNENTYFKCKFNDMICTPTVTLYVHWEKKHLICSAYFELLFYW